MHESYKPDLADDGSAFRRLFAAQSEEPVAAWPDILTVADFNALTGLRVFITSREKMHPDGVGLYDDIMRRLRDGFHNVTRAPSADRSAKAVAPDAWQFLGSSPQSGITEPFPTGRWRECLDPKAAKDAGYEVRPLWTHPPAQPASPGPLQPGAGWVTESRVEAAFKAFDKAAPDAYEYGMDAIRAALEAALSADHDAKEVMLTTDDVPIQRRGVLCTICGKIVPELEAAAHCAAHWGQL